MSRKAMTITPGDDLAAPRAARRWTLAEALNSIPAGLEVPYARVFAHGSMSLEIYAPRERDKQRPHEQDEVYVVMRGNGTFANGARRHPFGPGDALFVPAGAEHRFENFSDDIALWVTFWGPKGGEPAAPHPEPRGDLRWTAAEALGLIAPAAELRSVPVFEHGTLTLKLYNPRRRDPQKPHTRDELYFIQEGSGSFVCQGRRSPFGPGDALFAPAGAEHRFEAFGAALVTWVVFYGAEGGEA
jgi:mannose-6-phosphate isomerase-like protein (cupin superfamily)